MVAGSCEWDVVFDSNTGQERNGGQLPLLEADYNRSSYGEFSSSIFDVRSHRSRGAGLLEVFQVNRDTVNAGDE